MDKCHNQYCTKFTETKYCAMCQLIIDVFEKNHKAVLWIVKEHSECIKCGKLKN